MIPEILDGCGALVPAGDVPALSGAIARLVDRPDEARALGARARERAVERYSYAAARAELLPVSEALARR